MFGMKKLIYGKIAQFSSDLLESWPGGCFIIAVNINYFGTVLYLTCLAPETLISGCVGLEQNCYTKVWSLVLGSPLTKHLGATEPEFAAPCKWYQAGNTAWGLGSYLTARRDSSLLEREGLLLFNFPWNIFFFIIIFFPWKIKTRDLNAPGQILSFWYGNISENRKPTFQPALPRRCCKGTRKKRTTEIHTRARRVSKYHFWHKMMSLSIMIINQDRLETVRFFFWPTFTGNIW